MKLLFKVVYVILITLLLSVNVFADSNKSQIEEMLNNNSLKLASDKDIIIKSFSESLDDFKRLIDSDISKNVKMDKAQTLNNSEKAFKLFSINTSDLVKEYHKINNFKKMISNEYIWNIPIFDSNSKVIYLCTFEKGKKYEDLVKAGINITVQDKDEVISDIKKNEGKWHWTQINNMISNEWVEFLIGENKVSELLENGGITYADEIKLVSLPGLYTTMLYIEADGKEYGIPFCEISNLTTLKSGTLYEMGNLINIIEQSPTYTNIKSSGNSSGVEKIGNGAVKNTVPNSDKSQSKKHFNLNYIYYVAIVGVVILIASILVHTKHNKKAA